ncbi:hypothetical protein [Helicobacter cappadocius]|uniref:Uncharacterized protein n=1 Tax=Helicobacter cappadocius TaxID=3063998 RepID=A0AA90PIY2_9HELI|nr:MULTISPECIES: hypothetical protein [unclassified Helicobacter]MDO7253801.1 hypothetical protein [Helicobacter sp. faydin-H75]MDP2538681.1 hypothetical protein [Helicobacter sp. faydin-H76]
MKLFRGVLFVLIFGVSSGYASDSLKLLLGADTRGTDSIYDSKYGDVASVKRYGYEGYIGGKIGIEYFFTKKNAILGFLGMGYANIKLLNKSDSFDLYSGVGTQVGLEYLFNYYSSEKFDFGLVAGVSYFNGYYERTSEYIISNEIFGILGVNTTINSRHRIELSAGIPIYSMGRYSNDVYKNVPVNRRFKNIYYGISYMYFFNL